MRARWPVLFVLAIVSGLPACGKSPVNGPAIAWLTRVEAACEAAHDQGKPLLFFYAAEWDVATAQLEHSVFVDPEVRRIVRRDYVALRVDRSNTYMSDGTAPADEVREVDEAVRRFRPYASKYATVLVTGPDCATERDRFEIYEPRAFAARLRSAAAM